MPLSTHPAIRARQKCMENAGLLPVLDSVGFTTRKNQVTAGIIPNQNDWSQSFLFNNTSHTPDWTQ